MARITNQRNSRQTERDRVYVARYYLQGLTQYEIAERMTKLYIEWVQEEKGRDLLPLEYEDYEYTRRMAQYDISKIREAWLTSAMLDLNERLSQELAKIDHLEATYWEAWERSLQPKEIEIQESLEAGGQGEEAQEAGGRNRYKVGFRKETRDGNAAFLTGVMQCIEKRTRLLGFDKSPNISWEDRLPEGYTIDEVHRQFLEALKGPPATPPKLIEGKVSNE